MLPSVRELEKIDELIMSIMDIGNSNRTRLVGYILVKQVVDNT